MNLAGLENAVRSVSEIAVIGKSALLEGVVCHAVGLVRRGAALQLLLLEYDGEYRERLEEAEIEELTGAGEAREGRTNRAVLRGDGRIEPADPLRPVARVTIGEREFVVSGAERTCCGASEWDCAALFTRFLLSGWQPVGIEYPDMDTLYLSALELEGEYSAIPDLGEDRALRFTLGPEPDFRLVEQRVTLSVGESPKKLTFREKVKGSEHTVTIHRVYLCDMWAEMEKTFAELALKERLGEEELASCRENFERGFQEACPRGLCYPAVEYECGEDITLQFHTRAWLNSEPVPRSGGMAFLLRADKPQDGGGERRAALLQEPMGRETKTVEAELFQISVTRAPRELLIP